MNITESLELVLEHMQSGNIRQAEHICKKILKKRPDNADALHFLGIIYSELGNYDLARDTIKKALQIDPNFADAYNNLGNIFYRTGQFDEAITHYKTALQLHPDLARTYYNLGIALQEKKQLDEAIHSYQKALELHMSSFGLYNNLGLALHEKGRIGEAIHYYQRAVDLDPGRAEAYYNLGNAMKDSGKPDQAIVAYEKDNQNNPNYAEAYNNLGIILKDKGYFDEAIMHYKNALHLNSNYTEAYNNLGIALKDKGYFDEALTYFEKALQSNPKLPITYFNLGAFFYETGQFDKAKQHYENALLIDMDYADAHYNLAHTLLLCGNFSEGWRELEWRWKTEDFLYRQRTFLQPTWDGSSLQGRTLFIYAEQGVGDEIMFASCFPDVIDRATLCIIECDRRLVPLFSRSFPAAQCIERSTSADSIQPVMPDFDVVIATGSLPLYLRSHLATFPQKRAYLIPDPVKVDRWRNLLTALGEGLKVGISWRGGKKPHVKKARSILLEKWEEIFSVEGIHFINLQYGDCKAELQEVKDRFGVLVHNWDDADPLKDLDNFSAQISALDLVISIDNATVHMAGSLGMPVWTLLPFVPDWRWMLHREDSPWYPTMRLYRQPSLGDWVSVMGKVKDGLLKLLGHN
jgi:tetratricopeptide (TPR) repeat protein